VPKQQLRIGNVDLIMDDQMVFERFHWGGDVNFVALDPNKMPFHLCVVTNNAALKQVGKPAIHE
jgi:hypothetical protein